MARPRIKRPGQRVATTRSSTTTESTTFYQKAERLHGYISGKLQMMGLNNNNNVPSY